MEKEKTREHLKQREEQIASIFEKAKSELKKAQRWIARIKNSHVLDTEGKAVPLLHSQRGRDLADD